MYYLLCDHPGRLTLQEKDVPSFNETVAETQHFASLRIEKVGICGTDLHAFQGNQPYFTYPRILGHELSARVEAVGSRVTNVQPGDRVAVMPYLSCGTCIACRQGKTNCCTQIQVLGVHTDGGMQEYLTLPADILIPLNDLSADEVAVIEPLAIGAHALRRADVQAGETIVVIGCGPIGLGLMKQARLRGARVIALDVNAQRLAYAKTAMEIEHLVDASNQAVEQVRELTHGDLAAAVFDASGNRQALEGGIDFMAHGGRYVLVGLSKGELTFRHPAIHAKETSLLCSRNATMDDFHAVIGVLRAGAFPVDAFITHRVGFRELVDCMASWTRPETGVVKGMADWS